MFRSDWLKKLAATVMVATVMVSFGSVNARAQSANTIDNMSEIPDTPIIGPGQSDVPTVDGPPSNQGEVKGESRENDNGNGTGTNGNNTNGNGANGTGIGSNGSNNNGSGSNNNGSGSNNNGSGSNSNSGSSSNSNGSASGSSGSNTSNSTGSGSVLGASRSASSNSSAVVGGDSAAVLGAARSPKTADGSLNALVMLMLACFAASGSVAAVAKKRA